MSLELSIRVSWDTTGGKIEERVDGDNPAQRSHVSKLHNALPASLFEPFIIRNSIFESLFEVSTSGNVAVCDTRGTGYKLQKADDAAEFRMMLRDFEGEFDDVNDFIKLNDMLLALEIAIRIYNRDADFYLYAENV